ncbi:MAG: nucleotidyl transferase AbiEii/AbiGii toxin family protein [Actinobacteria bacterium]|nr:nucleotidyl transferase AbiEii/AbiGii toxin family protein [Actinomycetota bacterium]
MKIDLLSKSQLSIANKNNFRYPLAIAEKDYLLAVVLQIIYNSPLKDTLIFKGGTAIHHLYLNQLRFSEDLDFATAQALTIDDIKEVFEPYDFLEVVKFYHSDFALKIERLKFTGPLEQPNSIKIDIDLTQRLILPAQKRAYRNIYGVSATVLSMDLKEICAEKVRAINERARYRDFYDLALVLKEHNIEAKEIVEILKQKELRKPLSKNSILGNLQITEEARQSGAENLYYREEIALNEIKKALDGLLYRL